MLSLNEKTAFAPCPSPFNLAAYVLTRAADLADKSALTILHRDGPEVWTYGQLDRAVRGVANGLVALGLKPGARVLLRLGNSVEFPLGFLGAVAAGLLPVTAPSALTSPEVTRLVKELDPALVLVGQGIMLPDLKVKVLCSTDLLAMAAGPASDFILGDPDRPAYMVYTSGTSGHPRAVVHAHRAVWARKMMWSDWYDLREDDRLLHAGSLNWTYTLGTGLFDPLAIGASAFIPDASYTPKDLGGLLDQSQATLFAAAPGIYRQMLKSGERLVLPKLRHGLSAGEKLPEAVRIAWHAATGKPLHEAFGMSECSTFLSSCPARPATGGATGYPQNGRSIAVLAPDGAPVPRGSEGVLAIDRGDPGLFLGYFGAPEDTQARFMGNWFLSGDLVRMALDGEITYLGRTDDMMNAGGFRVSPLEVEAALGTCADIGEVAAVELQRGPATTILAAFYTGRVSVTELEAHAQSCLARYKQPRFYQRLDRLPVNANGKVNRRELREKWRIAD